MFQKVEPIAAKSKIMRDNNFGNITSTEDFGANKNNGFGNDADVRKAMNDLLNEPESQRFIRSRVFGNERSIYFLI